MDVCPCPCLAREMLKQGLLEKQTMSEDDTHFSALFLVQMFKNNLKEQLTWPVMLFCNADDQLAGK